MNELVNIISRMQELYYTGLSGVLAIIFAAVAVVGLVQCFFGYKLMRVCFAICGFAIGALGAGVGAGIAANNMAIVLVVALIGGVLVALLLFHVYRLGVFFLNFALVTVIVFLAGNASYASLILGAVTGIVIGVVAAIMVRICTILSTGCAGGIVAGFSIGGILHISGVGLVLGIVLAAAGIVVQFKTTEKNKNRPTAEPCETVASTTYHNDIAISEPASKMEVKTVIIQTPVMSETVSTPSQENHILPKLCNIATAVVRALKSILELIVAVTVCLVRCAYYTVKLKLKYPETTY